MNVKKRLQKILDYVRELEAENMSLVSKVAELEKPKLMVGGDTFGVWSGSYQNIDHDQTMTLLQEENARLREQLRWHSVDELPRRSEHKTISVDVVLKTPIWPILIAWYRYDRSEWWAYGKQQVSVSSNSRWCYIPEGGE